MLPKHFLLWLAKVGIFFVSAKIVLRLKQETERGLEPIGFYIK